MNTPPAILIVEDDAALRHFMQYMLALDGFDVDVVQDGLAALRRIDEVLPDVVILDLTLPRVDGISVYRELASNPRTAHIPVVIITGREVLADAATQAAAILRKPVAFPVLLDSVHRAIAA